ncbi:DUF732 domain-containing protein [Nocardia halotolerans]|uniref:DUF732 domain-containing protein n=1 Tax=Nocardia halotolerans TaxID=1755878 RepID=A0ABV8VKQ1_9NOCA
MHRIPGKVAGSVAALAAVALLSACGDNDSTASQTPTLSSSAIAAASTTQAPAAPPEAEHGEHAPSETAAPETQEQPQAAPDPGESAPTSDKDQAFLDELGNNGIHPADKTSAITAATYICSARATGAADGDIATFVAAMAGTDSAFDESKMDVNKAAEIYIAAATATYC